MEVSVIANSQAKILGIESASRELRFFVPKNNNLFVHGGNGSFRFLRQSSRWRKIQLRFTLKAVKSQHVVSDKASGPTSADRSQSPNGLRLFVGLPLDTVSDCNTVKHARAIAAGLKALKLLGVEGVELPIWWGIAEKEAMGKYEWSGYLAVAEMVQKIGLKLHVSLCFHGSKEPKIPLPRWVSQIGESQSSIYYTDKRGQQYKECLSLAVDDLPVLYGKSPIQVYHDFCKSFRSSFMRFLGSTITGVSISLGPDGELRYPSHHQLSKSSQVPGAGEFQCYDTNMLSLLKQHAEATGNPMWGLGGPHNAPDYNESPNSNTFFKDEGGSWESPYGDFFLNWYSTELISHGNRLLSLASSTFEDTGVAIYGKVPLVHPWYKTRSHPSELTAGFYNTANRDGYTAVADIFAKNSSKIILPGLDLSDNHQPKESLSSPESLLAQIKMACRKHGVEVSGQNSSVTIAPRGFEQIKKNLVVGGNSVGDLFTYQRMGAYFFSPEHFPSFTEFVRNLNQPALHSDDLLKGEKEQEDVAETVNINSDSSIQVQAA